MYVEIGAYLRQAREAIGLTLDDVQEKTKIQKSFLIAIENGDFDKLPSPFYVRTYLRYYANCVKVEPHHILRQYRKVEQAVRYGIEPSSNSLQNTTRIPIINLNTGPQQSVAQTTGKNPVRRINTQTALTIAKVPQTTGKVPQMTGTNPRLSSPEQVGATNNQVTQRFASGPQQVLSGTQKLPTISSKPGQVGQTTQKFSAITQKLPTISKKPPTADSGRFRPNLQNTGVHSLFNTKEQKIPESLSAMAGQMEAAASAEQREQTNPNLRSSTNPRMQTNPKVGMEQTVPPQKTSSSASSLDNTLGKTGRMRRIGGLQNTNPPQPPAHEPEREELQSTQIYRRGATRRESRFSIPKNRLMPIAITVAVLLISIIGMVFLFGNGNKEQAHKPNTVGQAPVQTNAVQDQQPNSNANTNENPAEVALERVPGKHTYILKGTNTLEIEVIPVSGDCNIVLYDGNPESQNAKPKMIDDKTVMKGSGPYKKTIVLSQDHYHVYIKLGNYSAVKVMINGTEIQPAKVIRITLPGHV